MKSLPSLLLLWPLMLAGWLLAAPPARAQVTAPAADDALADRATERRGARARPARSAWRWGVDGVLVEAGATPSHDSVDGTWDLRAVPYLQWQPSRAWELRLGLLAEGNGQTGSPDYTRWRADAADSYVRWRSGDTRLTFGEQTVLWGRVDGVPVIDRVSRVDLTRLLLDDLPDRRRSQFALRWEQNWDDIKLDTVVLPAFRGAALPSPDSLWNPVNRRTGRIFGISPSPAVAALVGNARFDQQDGGYGGLGLRLTSSGEPFDFGLTVARTRQSLPYYEPDFVQGRLTAVHPFTSLVAVDAEVVWGGATWRTELGFTRDAPFTALHGHRMSGKLVEWVGAVEFFPGGEGTRVNLQLVAREARLHDAVLELKSYVGLNGEVETRFGQDRWKAALQFATGLSVNDVYLSPRLSYVGFEPHEIYLAVHLFSGSERTLGGFYRDNDFVALGLRTRF